MATTFTHVSVERPQHAPFSSFATDGESKLIPDKAVEDLQTLTWESLIVKNYCLAVNQQAPIKIDKLTKLPLIQKTSRTTAELWLNKIASAVNEVYTESSFFYDSFDIYYDKLIELAKGLENNANKELFTNSLGELQTNVDNIRAKVESLNRALQDFRPRLETDVRNFSELVDEAKKIYKGNTFKIETLNDEIEALKAEISSLNKKIAATATVGTLSLLGLIGVVIGAVLILPSAGTSLAIVGASLAVTGIGTGASYALLGEYHRQLKVKKSEYNLKSEELQQVQEETAAAMTVEKQYTPLIKSGSEAIQVVQTLLEGWKEIYSNFGRFKDEIVKTKNADPDKIRQHLDATKTAVKNINDVIEKHKKAGVINVYSEGDIAAALSPAYARMRHNEALVLPQALHNAYVKRMWDNLTI
ncbi:MAG: HBL/NHE enterotoxin family protein [Cellulomonas sp.]|nr:HBL/NHE enterotoxin family protein [Rickettsiella sp.]